MSYLVDCTELGHPHCAQTREEGASWGAAGVAGLAIPGSWLGRMVTRRIFSGLLYGERPCPSKGVLRTEQDGGKSWEIK